MILEIVDRKLLIVIVMSCVTLGLTQMWYLKTQQKSSEKDNARVAVAYLREKQNDVEQKLSDRLIWNILSRGQALYQGDNVRTASKSSGEVVFVKSGAVVSLDEETNIVIDELQGQPTLNLIKGSLFAKTTAGAVGAPTIISGNKKFSISDTKSKTGLMLAATGKKNEVSGCVIDGSIKLNSDQEQKQLKSGDCNSKSLVEIISPRQNTVISRTDRSSSAIFSWKGLKDNAIMKFKIGPSRNSLQQVAATADQLPTGSLAINVPEGVFYWQLVAFDGDKEIAKSLVFQAEGVTLSAPSLRTPNDGEKFTTEAEKVSMTLSWTPSKLSQNQKVQIADDANFQNVILVKDTVDSELAVELPKDKEYYWRVVRSWSDKTLPPVSSAVRKFSIASVVKLAVPTLIAPKNGEQITAKSDGQGIRLSWDPVQGAEVFQIKVESTGLGRKNYESKENFFQLKEFSPGELTWTVKAISSATESKWAEPHKFIATRPQISWLEPKERDIESLDPKPKVKLEWTPSDGVSQWTVSWRYEDGKNFQKSEKYSDTKASVELPTDGKWSFSVTGADNRGNVLVKADPLVISIKTLRLDTPSLLDVVDHQIIAKEKVKLVLRWKATKDAKVYETLLTSKMTGKTTRKEQEETSYEIEDLEPGDYEFKFQAKNDRTKSEFSEIYSIKIKPVELSAPKIKKIIIK